MIKCATQQKPDSKTELWLIKIFDLNRMKLLLTICFILFCSSLLYARDKDKNYVYDSSHIIQRSFSDSAINAYKSDPDFQYEKKMIQQRSWWDRFWDWFWSLYDDIMDTEAGRITMEIIYWALALGIIAFFVTRVLKMNRLSVFKNTAYSDAPYKVELEDINAIPFDTAINEAMENGNYRLAIRLLYLQNLKLLSDKGLIDWRPDKTNTDYLYELKSSLQQSFKKITTVFEYAWYGEHAVSKQDCADMKDQLSQFQNQL